MPAGEVAQICYGGGGERTHIICGFLGSAARHHPLVDALPKVLNLPVRDGPAGEWVESSFRYAAREVAAGHASSETILSKLSELLFVQTVRRYLESDSPTGTVARRIAGPCDRSGAGVDPCARRPSYARDPPFHPSRFRNSRRVFGP
jgi:hypothetical protein